MKIRGEEEKGHKICIKSLVPYVILYLSLPSLLCVQVNRPLCLVYPGGRIHFRGRAQFLRWKWIPSSIYPHWKLGGNWIGCCRILFLPSQNQMEIEGFYGRDHKMSPLPQTWCSEVSICALRCFKVEVVMWQQRGCGETWRLCTEIGSSARKSRYVTRSMALCRKHWCGPTEVVGVGRDTTRSLHNNERKLKMMSILL